MHITPPPTFLLACDTPAVDWAFRRALARYDHRRVVRTVNKPATLAGEIGFVRPVAVILELSLLGEVAGDAITELAAQHPDVRIVVYGDDAQRLECLEAGADAFIAIGSCPDTMREAVDGVLGARAAA